MAGSKSAASDEEAVEYEVLIGINYPPNKRAEPGDIVTDLPYGTKTNLIAMGAIKRVAE